MVVEVLTSFDIISNEKTDINLHVKSTPAVNATELSIHQARYKNDGANKLNKYKL